MRGVAASPRRCVSGRPTYEDVHVRGNGVHAVATRRGRIGRLEPELKHPEHCSRRRDVGTIQTTSESKKITEPAGSSKHTVRSSIVQRIGGGQKRSLTRPVRDAGRMTSEEMSRTAAPRPQRLSHLRTLLVQAMAPSCFQSSGASNEPRVVQSQGSGSAPNAQTSSLRAPGRTPLRSNPHADRSCLPRTPPVPPE